MTTNERYSRKNDGENRSILSRSLTDNPMASGYMEETAREDSLLRTTFMGPKNASGAGNGFRMCTHRPPSQIKMKEEFI